MLLPQFQDNLTGAPSRPTGAGSHDAQGGPIQPSEMKGEGYVFQPLLSAVLSSLFVVVSEIGQCVQLLSGSLHAYESPHLSLLLHAFLPRCYGELGRPRTSRTVTSYLSISCYQDDDVKTSSCVLRYVALLRLRLRHILRSASSAHSLSLYLLSGTIRHVLTARCLSAAYPGIQPTVLYLLLTLAPLPLLQSHSILLTYC